MSQYDDIEEIFAKLSEDGLSLEEKYRLLREAYVYSMKLMNTVRLELNKKYVAAIRDEKEKRQAGRSLLADRTDNTGVAQFKVIEMMAGDAAICDNSADRYMILQKMLPLIQELCQIL
jgi:hypothetical protein